ncbi:hypothetical protein F2S72_01420 [Pseudomonas syringae pv. actinidiae]|nr:hypothetical protein [Pseudomonas syringae pv. actinidiae]
MVKSYSPQQAITETVNYLEYRLSALASQMANHPERLRVDAAFLIPFRGRGTVDAKACIPVSPMDGPAAIAQVILGLTAVRIVAGEQNPRETLRVPAVVGLPAEWIDELANLNNVRAQIEDLLSKIEDPRERVGVWKPWRYMSGLQVMRQTWIANGPRRITFFWDAAPSVVSKTAEQWIEAFTKELTALHGYVPEMAELDESSPSRKEVFLIDAFRQEFDPSEKIAAFRVGQPHVRARVTFHDTQKLKLKTAPTPIVYEYDDLVPTIIPLSNWEPDVSAIKDEKRVRVKRDKRTREQTICEKPLFKGYGFHRYE